MNADDATTQHQVHAVTSKWISASEARDLNALAELASRDFSIYLDFLGKTLDRPAFLDFLRAAYASPMQVVYRDKRLMVSPEGFVEQATVHMTVAGTEYAVPVCVVARVTGDHVTRIDEYCDPRRLPQ